MKKIFYILVAQFIYLNATAQTTLTLDQQLSNVNQTSVTSGIIYERVAQFANLYNFNLSTDYNTANFKYFKQALTEMNRASNGTKFTTLTNFKNLISTTTLENQVDIAILNTQFHIINYNEENPSLGGLTYNTTTNKYSQIAGKVPFYMLNTSVISPTKDNVTGTSVTYKIRNDLYFKNGTKVIKTLTANLGDGIIRTLINNQVLTNQNITVNYNTSGEKTLIFTITYTDNTTLITNGKIYFQYSDAGNRSSNCFINDPLKQDFVLQADIPFTGYQAGDPTIKAKIDYRVFYASADRKVRKPIIIIDGFDPGDKRKIEDCDCENNTDCSTRNTTNGQFDPEKHRAMTDLMYYYNPNTQQHSNILTELRALGYDIIMVNQPTYVTKNLQNNQDVTIDGGAYYIESNAFALVKLITQVKQLLVINGSASQIAIVGPSMGGQISRYALAYMEKNNIPHNVYLWISVDSPHLGANIPMGDQALINLLKSDSTSAEDFYNKELASPASKQLLIEFHNEGSDHNTVNQNLLNAQTISQGYPTNAGNPIFQQYYNNLNNNGITNSHGYPMNLRKISLVNGSLTGKKFGVDSQNVLTVKAFNRIHVPLPIGQYSYSLHLATLEADFMPSTGATGQISYYNKSGKTKNTICNNVNIRGNMDIVPGGYFAAQNDINQAITGAGVFQTRGSFWQFTMDNITYFLSSFNGSSGYWETREFNPIHSFIPSFSAIAHKQPNQNWGNSLNRNLVCSNETYFDGFFGHDENTQHTSFNYDSFNWLKKELAGQPQAPWFPLKGDDLLGLDKICINVNSAYNFVNSCKVPSNAVWTVSPNLDIVNFNGYSITVNPNDNGAGFITATFQNGMVVTKNIWVGVPAFNNFTFGGTRPSQSLCIAPANNYSYSIPELNTTDKIIANFTGLSSSEALVNTNWEWQPLNELIILNGTKNSRNICTMGAGQTSISVRVKNACGWSDWTELQFEITELPPTFRQSQLIYTIHPNPSNDVVNVDLRSKDNPPAKDATISGELFDLRGLSKTKVKISNNKATFSVKGLNRGIYVLKIYINDQVESHQIAVE